MKMIDLKRRAVHSETIFSLMEMIIVGYKHDNTVD